MATVIRTICDRHQAGGDEVDATTRRYHHPITGKSLELDLCDTDADELTLLLGPGIELLDKFGLPAGDKPTPRPATRVGTKISCPYCPEVCGGAQGLAMHGRKVHPEKLSDCPVPECKIRPFILPDHLRSEHKRYYREVWLVQHQEPAGG